MLTRLAGFARTRRQSETGSGEYDVANDIARADKPTLSP